MRNKTLPKLGGSALPVPQGRQQLCPPAPLSALHHRATDAALPRDVENGAPFSRVQNDLRPLLQAIAISDSRRQSRALFGRLYDADGLSHAQSIAYLPQI